MTRIAKLIKDKIFNFLTSSKQQIEIPITQIKEDGCFLKGKTALITGGSGGIGIAIAKKFISCGCKVIIAGTNTRKLNARANQMGGHVILPY